MSEVDFSRTHRAGHGFAPVAPVGSSFDLGTQLESLDALLTGLNGELVKSLLPTTLVTGEKLAKHNRATEEESSKLDSCSQPKAKIPDLKGKFPSLSQLTCVQRYLESRAKVLEDDECRNQNTAQHGSVELSCDDARVSALDQIHGMLSEIVTLFNSATTGKDCRAAMMMVQ
jgi:hypothetical protein